MSVDTLTRPTQAHQPQNPLLELNPAAISEAADMFVRSLPVNTSDSSKEEVAKQQLGELRGFVKNWRNKPLAQIIEEMASWSMETRRITDPYEFAINKQRELVSPQTGDKILEVVERQRYAYSLGEQEYQAIYSLQQDLIKGGHSQWVWISPPEEGIYKETKVIFSNIEKKGSQEVLSNRAIILDDFSYLDCLRLATDLNHYSQNPKEYSNKDSIRSRPITIDVVDPNWRELLRGLVKTSQMEQAISAVESGDDIKAKQETLVIAEQLAKQLFDGQNRITAQEVFSALDENGVLGGFGSSCPKIVFGTFLLGSAVLGGEYFCRRCGACGAEINQVVRPGERCPKGCGAVRKCA